MLEGPPLDLEGVQALLCTSANGVRATAARTTGRDLPVLAVGDATARAARDEGFAQVESARGDVESLARLAKARLDPAAGRLFHAAGSAVAGDLAGDLGSAGFRVERHVLYAAEPVHRTGPDTAEGLYAGTIDAVLFFSPRTAQSFVKVVLGGTRRSPRRGRGLVPERGGRYGGAYGEVAGYPCGGAARSGGLARSAALRSTLAYHPEEKQF